MLDFIELHGICPEIDRKFPLDNISEALKALQRPHRFGKIVVTIA